MSDQQNLLAYKGFDKDLRCRGFAYEIGKEYTNVGDVSPCSSGFHACTKASDVWSYYGPADSRYARVELSGTVVPHSEDSKHASSKIKVIEEITPADFMKLVISEILDGAISKEQAASGDSSQLAAAGYSSKLAASGDSSQLAASGDSSKLAAAGDSSKLAAAGYSSKLAAAGDYSVIASSSVISSAKGCDGTWIALAEYDCHYKCVGFAVGCIGKDGLEADTWYKASGGKLVRSDS